MIKGLAGTFKEFYEIHERQLGDINKELRIKVSLELSSLEAEGQGLKTLPCHWNSGSPAGNSNYPVHNSLPNPMECEPEPVLRIGYHHYVPAEGLSVPRSMAVEANNIQGWTL